MSKYKTPVFVKAIVCIAALYVFAFFATCFLIGVLK